MKCPKCGYNSFEFNDVCKRCSQDLTGYKTSFGLKPIVLPQERRTELATTMHAEPEQEQTPPPTEESPSDIFSFDLPEETPAAAGATNKDDFFKFEAPAPPETPAGYNTFSFDDDSATNQAKALDDAFADLLESSPLASSDPFAGQNTAQGGDTSAEYELSSFSWDEPAEPAAPGEKKPVDDFESLFGDIGSVTKK